MAIMVGDMGIAFKLYQKKLTLGVGWNLEKAPNWIKVFVTVKDSCPIDVKVGTMSEL